MSQSNGGAIVKRGPRKTAATAGPLSVRFHVTVDRAAELQMGDLIDLQDGVNDPRIVARVVGTFAVDENGEYLPTGAAQQVVRQMTVRQLQTTFASIMAEVNEVAVPNE